MNQKLIKGGHTSHLPLHTSNRGITLIALVITIIVLLILAGVTINMVLGDDGIIQNAQKAKNLNKDGQIEEALDLLRAEVKMAEHGLETTLTLPLDAEGVINELLKDDIVEPNVLEKKGTKTIGYTDETKTKTFSLEGIVKWDNSQAEYFEISSNGRITSYKGEGGKVIIPEEIDGVKVTSIGDLVFYGCGLTSIEIPEGVTSIGADAFSWNSSLTSIIIPDGVTSLGVQLGEMDGHDGLFYECTSLTNVKLPSSLTSIEGDSFIGCSSLTSIIIPDSVESIGGRAFSCTSLTSINIPGSVKSIGSEAFAYCENLTSITISEGVESIGDDAFNSCGLTSIIIPNSVTSIGSGLIMCCYNLTSAVLPEGLTNIPDYMFCEAGLTSITIPDGVESIGECAFSCCSLTSIIIPDSVNAIASWAFQYCSGLKSVTIEGTITELGEEVFEGVYDCEIIYQGEKYKPAEFETLING